MFSRFLGNEVLKRIGGGKFNRPGRIRAIIILPTLLRLSYSLFRDERVPIWQRVTAIGLVGLIFSPLDLPGDIPVIGQFWDFTLAVTVLTLFIQMAPATVVNEHIVRLGLEKKIPLRSV